MPPQIASLLTLGLIAFLFRRDRRERVGVTGQLWIPLLWILVIIGKSVAEWVNILFGFSLEGAITIDSVVWAALIVAGFRILWQRRVSLGEVFRDNRALGIFLAYSGLAVLWSDSPYTSFKHWIAILGHPIMVLIILTEPDPEEALKSLLKRCAFVTILVSVLLIRYYPQWGRTFSGWTGDAQRAGFANDKNSQGVICMICGIFFVWHLLNTLRLERSKIRRHETALCVTFLVIIAWLFKGLNCGTALVSMAAGIATIFAVELPGVNKQFIGRYLLVATTLLLVMEPIFGLKDTVTNFIGKDSTLTGRTDMWAELIGFDFNPLIGAGYESFWQGERLNTLWEEHWWKPNQAHNGYLDTYLNLGLIGLLTLFIWILASFRKSLADLARNSRMGTFRFGFLIAIALYNWTESAFKTLHPVFFMFFLASIDHARLKEDLHEQPISEADQTEQIGPAGDEEPVVAI